jgi:hypothetical protein
VTTYLDINDLGVLVQIQNPTLDWLSKNLSSGGKLLLSTSMSDIEGILGTPAQLVALKEAFKQLQMQVSSIRIPDPVDLSDIYNRLDVATQQPLDILVNGDVLNKDSQVTSINFKSPFITSTITNGSIDLSFHIPERLSSNGGTWYGGETSGSVTLSEIDGGTATSVYDFSDQELDGGGA